MGQKAYGSDKVKTVTDGSVKTSNGFMFKDIKKTPSFILFALTMFTLALVGVGINNQYLAHLSDRGYSIGTLNLVNSILMIGLIFAKPVLGILLDKIGGLMTFTICSGSYIACLVSLGLSQDGNMIFPVMSALFFAFAASITSMGPSFLAGEFYGKVDFATTYSIVLTIYNFGAAASAPIAGVSYDLTGSYTMLGILFLILIACMVTMLKISKSTIKKINEGLSVC